MVGKHNHLSETPHNRGQNMTTEANWVRVRIDYGTYLVIPSTHAQQLFEVLTMAKSIQERQNGPVMQDSVPGFDFVTNEYVAGAAARAKMLDKQED